jgi:hypothetical protein
MNPIFVGVVARIREKLPSLDVRTDQGDVVRMHAGRMLVTIEQKGAEYVAKIISLEGKTDFDTTLHGTLASGNLAEFEVAVLRALRTFGRETRRGKLLEIANEFRAAGLGRSRRNDRRDTSRVRGR